MAIGLTKRVLGLINIKVKEIVFFFIKKNTIKSQYYFFSKTISQY